MKFTKPLTMKIRLRIHVYDYIQVLSEPCKLTVSLRIFDLWYKNYINLYQNTHQKTGIKLIHTGKMFY